MTRAIAPPCRFSALSVLLIHVFLSASVLFAHGAYVLTSQSDSSNLINLVTSRSFGCPQLLPHDPPGKPNANTTRLLHSSRVIGGNRANTAVIQSLVLLSISEKADALCTGSLIGPRYAVTAAHCVYDTSVQYVFVGGSNRHNGTPYSIKRIHVFPRYDTSHASFYDMARFDMAFVELNASVPANSARFMKVNVNPAFPRVGSVVRVAGYGETNLKHSSDYHQLPAFQLDIPVSKPFPCNSETFYLDNSRMFCAGYFNRMKRCSPCHGDSGAPMFQYDKDGHPVIVGVVSGGEHCGSGGFNVRISTYHAFLPRAGVIRTNETIQVMAQQNPSPSPKTTTMPRATQSILPTATQPAPVRSNLVSPRPSLTPLWSPSDVPSISTKPVLPSSPTWAPKQTVSYSLLPPKRSQSTVVSPSESSEAPTSLPSIAQSPDPIPQLTPSSLATTLPSPAASPLESLSRSPPPSPFLPSSLTPLPSFSINQLTLSPSASPSLSLQRDPTPSMPLISPTVQESVVVSASSSPSKLPSVSISPQLPPMTASQSLPHFSTTYSPFLGSSLPNSQSPQVSTLSASTTSPSISAPPTNIANIVPSDTVNPPNESNSFVTGGQRNTRPGIIAGSIIFVLIVGTAILVILFIR